MPLAGHVRVGVAIFSYDGALSFGVTGDYDSAPDIGVLCRGIERSIAELAAVAGGAAAPAGADAALRARPAPRAGSQGPALRRKHRRSRLT